jgi:hypothetical protein
VLRATLSWSASSRLGGNLAVEYRGHQHLANLTLQADGRFARPLEPLCPHCRRHPACHAFLLLFSTGIDAMRNDSARRGPEPANVDSTIGGVWY